MLIFRNEASDGSYLNSTVLRFVTTNSTTYTIPQVRSEGVLVFYGQTYLHSTEYTASGTTLTLNSVIPGITVEVWQIYPVDSPNSSCEITPYRVPMVYTTQIYRTLYSVLSSMNLGALTENNTLVFAGPIYQRKDGYSTGVDSLGAVVNFTPLSEPVSLNRLYLNVFQFVGGMSKTRLLLRSELPALIEYIKSNL